MMAILFDEIIKSLKEYSTEDIDDPEAAKSEITELLKSHRPVKLSDFEYGFSQAMKKDHRLIIKEKENELKVREYLKIGNSWKCSKRFGKNHKCLSHDLKIKYGIVFAPINHRRDCKTKEYSFVIKVQDSLKQGNIYEARCLTQNRKTSLKDSSNQSLSTSMLNESTLSTTTDNENMSMLDNSRVDDTIVSIASNITSSLSQTSTSTSNVAESARSSVKREIEDSDYCMIVDGPAAKKPKIESNKTDVETFFFDHPSASILEKVCKKMEIEYDHSAYKFWGDIIFRKIVSASENIKTHSLKSRNIFACFSQFFTGKSDSCFLFQHIIYSAFRKELNDSGEKSSAEIDEILFNNTVPDNQHLEFVAKFLSCRIGIYENGILKKFGKWEIESDALSLILLFENGFYSVVLDL